ncbi:splicing factor, suppressor of white-apricot homolog [Diaphorina citri]|uniref:Splicing factor, suppressor of white-apricot homolog n=1 Tax=Diaphorina citri TaxID=121845 RepID=A0A1S3DFG8_DIACI|nr:splicing factor, suppressor of white-apricot homolog [Diaphorina citri]
MEILLKMKQASNPHFGFLSFDNPLYPFYRHVLSAIQSGRYMPGTYEQQKSSELNSSSEQEDCLHPSLQVPTMSTLPESVSISRVLFLYIIKSYNSTFFVYFLLCVCC